MEKDQKNIQAARALVRLAKSIVSKANRGTGTTMTKDEMLDFLYSQVKRIRIELPSSGSFPVPLSSIRLAARKNPRKKFKEEQQKTIELENRWRVLKDNAKNIPEGNGGQPFYEGFWQKVIANQSIPIVLQDRTGSTSNPEEDRDPYSECNKNNPRLYRGIDNENDLRKFLLSKYKNNQLKFVKCFANPFTKTSMVLDVYNTTAIVKDTGEELVVYIKFGIT